MVATARLGTLVLLTLLVAACDSSQRAKLKAAEDAAPSASSASGASPTTAPKVTRETCSARRCIGEAVQSIPALRSFVLGEARLVWGTLKINARPEGELFSLPKPTTLGARGAQPTRLPVSGGVSGLALDGHQLFIVQPSASLGGQQRLLRLDLTSEQAKVLAEAPVLGPHLALTEEDVVYSERQMIRAVSRGGGRSRILDQTPRDYSLHTDGQTVYWARESEVMRWRAGKLESLLKRAHVSHIASTPDYLILGGRFGLECAHWTELKPRLLYGGEVRGLVAAQDHAYVVVGDPVGAALRKIALKDGRQTLMARLPDAASAALVLDERHVYYSDSSTATLRRLAR